MHSKADIASLMWCLANKARELKLQHKPFNRGGVLPKPFRDLRYTGRQKYESSSLAMYNKKVQDLKAGNMVEGEMDDIAAPSFCIERVATD